MDKRRIVYKRIKGDQLKREGWMREGWFKKRMKGPQLREGLMIEG